MKYKRIPLINSKFKKTKKKKLQWYYFFFPIIIFIIILIQMRIRLFQTNSFFSKNEPFKMRRNLPHWNYTDIIENYFGKLPHKYKGEVNHELRLFRGYMKLKTISEDGNTLADQMAKQELYHRLGGKVYSRLKNIYVMGTWKFGNRMIMLNHMIYYFELLKEKKNLYLNKAHHWFIKDNITTEYVNISLVDNSTIDCRDNTTMCIISCPWILTPTIIMPEVRLGLLKPEMMKNLPKVETNPKDLYIHIRSGDIFKRYYPHMSYSQPPLCFYESVINTKKFRKIYLIAENRKNPVTKKLLEEYPDLIYNKSDVTEDIVKLMNAYNLVGSVSSFCQVCLIMNDNIKNYYEYDIYRKVEKFRHMHHECFRYPRRFNIYQMKPSEKYQGEMYFWLFSREQVKLMLEEKCDFSDFKLMKS